MGIYNLVNYGVKTKRKIPVPAIDYGASLLLTSNAYGSLLKINGEPVSLPQNFQAGNYFTVEKINFEYLPTTLELPPTFHHAVSNSGTNRGYILNGLNTYTLASTPPSGYYGILYFEGGGLTTSASLTNLKLNFGGSTFRTFEEAVNNNLIEPMVLISSSRGNQFI